MIRTFLLLTGLVLFTTCTREKVTEPIALDELTIAQIHDAYRNGLYTSEELVRSYLERIKLSDSAINAITFINPEALDAARELDAEYARTGVLRPLHGIPMVVKDNINTVGMPTTAGALALQDFYPQNDAFIIEKLLDAGAIILAKTNMAEWAFSPMHSESSTHGTTRNPYNLDRVPAGSSGGTAASVAANMATIGLGTDTGNSIRGPSSHNSLVGFRTTLGLISRSGIVPLYLRNDVVGPMCRTVEDATRVMEAMTGVDPKDEITRHSEGKAEETYLQYLQKNGLTGARIGVLRELITEQADPEIVTLFDQAISDLDSLGATIVDPVVIPGFGELRQDQWCAVFKEDLESFLAEHVPIDTVQTLEDVIGIGTRSEFANMRLVSSLNNSGRWGDKELECGNAYSDSRRVGYRTAIEKVMDSLNLDAIIYPTWNNKPAHIDRFQEEYLGDNSQVISPHTGQPAFTVPMGFTSGNLPAGLQFLGRMYSEPILIKLTYAYEQGTLHRKPPVLK